MAIREHILNNIPLISLFRYLIDGEKQDRANGVSDRVRNLKKWDHVIYGMGVVVGLELYTIAGLATHEWRPLYQYSAVKNLRQENRLNTREYEKALEKLFSMGGLADKDKNGIISYEEQFDAWNRMRLIDRNKFYFESDGANQFPKPKKEDLERAIESYKPK